MMKGAHPGRAQVSGMLMACKRATILITSTLLSLQALSSAACFAAEIPESVHQKYLMGTQTIRMPVDPARIPLSGTDWFGHYRSPYVRVYVNGHGPFTFLFDTGANVTTVSTKVADAASLQVISHVPGHHTIVRADEFTVGSVSMRNYYAVVADGDDVDGILGFNSFGKDFLTFDFAKKMLIVSRRAVPLPSASWLPYVLKKHLPLIDLFAGGRHLPTLIDTGDDAYGWEATSNDLGGLLFDHTPVLSSTVFNGETGATQTTVTPIDGSLTLGRWLSTRPAVAINESLPLPDIGMDVIEQFTLEFDRVNRRVAFQPRFFGPEFAVPGEVTVGFYISFRRPVRVVREVLPNLEPAKAGMSKGDRILTIDGRDASRLSFEDWDRLVRARRPIAIGWKNGNHNFSKTFPVVELR
jgi:predicted aspartyl protease